MEIVPWNDTFTPVFVEWFSQDPTLWHKVGFSRPPTSEELQLHLVTLAHGEMYKRAILRAAIDQGDLIAYFSAQVEGQSGLAHVIVSPSHRGKGLAATKLAVEEAHRCGLTYLAAYPNFRGADRWLRRVGFDVKVYGELKWQQ